MAIATTTALAIGGAALGAGASYLGQKSANKQAGKAADISAQTARENNALTRDIFSQNQANLTPFMNTGTAAMGNINALLGIAPQAAPQQAPQAPQAAAGSGLNGGFVGAAMNSGMFPDTADRLSGGGNWGAYLQANPDVSREYFDDNDERSTFATPETYAQWHYQNYGQNEGRALPGVAAGGQPIGQPTQPTAQQAFDTYRNSTGYQFRLGEGMNALNSGYAGAGTIKSGAAMKGAMEYGQNFASNEFGNYLGALGNQQALGMSGASALAGVGQNYTNTISANNNSAGTAAANAALSKQNPFANALGVIGGGMFGYGSK